MIRIKKSNTADTRTCDWSKVSSEELLTASEQHIKDVKKGMKALSEMLLAAAEKHDRTKISHLQEFHRDFQTGFKLTDWWKMHQKEERHHFTTPEFIQEDVNLIDVLEQIVDGVMAGMARSGKYRCEPVPNELLQKAYANTAKLLLGMVKVVTESFEHGRMDCYQDRCENIPFGSVGGLKCREKMVAPQYIKPEDAEEYLKGYADCAKDLYGPEWKTVKFSWQPTFEINKGARDNG